jgi:hypothetical protein
LICSHPELKVVVADFMGELDHVCAAYSSRLGPKLLGNSLIIFVEDCLKRCEEAYGKG